VVKLKLLIVEDEEDTLRELTARLNEQIPQLEIHSALSQVEAMDLLQNAASQHQPYDVALLDFKLPPHAGEHPEVNQTVYDELRNRMKDTVVIHTSAYPDDPIQMQRILNEAKQSPLNPRSVFLSKLDRRWADDVLTVVREIDLKRANTQSGSDLLDSKIKFQSCFISYSHADEEFVKILYSRLRNEGLQLWYAAEHMQPGRKIHEEIEQNIRIFDKLLLVISETSMKSNWVATEIRTAIQEEWITGKKKLFPIRLVSFDQVRDWRDFNSDLGQDMAVELREYYVPDFSKWTDTTQFEKAARKLIDSLRIQDDLPVTDAERALLDARLADMEAHPDDQSPWPEVKARLERLTR